MKITYGKIMQQAILIINLGSSSLKFAVFEIDNANFLNNLPILRGQFAPLKFTTKLKLNGKLHLFEKILNDSLFCSGNVTFHSLCTAPIISVLTSAMENRGRATV